MSLPPLLVWPQELCTSESYKHAKTRYCEQSAPWCATSAPSSQLTALDPAPLRSHAASPARAEATHVVASRARKRRFVVSQECRSEQRRFWQARKPGSASLLRRPYVTIDQRPRATHLGDSFEDHFPRVWGRQSKIPRSLGSFIHRRFSLHALARPQDQTTAFVEARDADAVRWFSWK